MGYVRIDRDIVNTLTPKERVVFLFLSTKVGWGEHQVWGVNVGAGQYLTTLREIAAELDTYPMKISRALSALRARDLVEVESVQTTKPRTAKMALITIKSGVGTSYTTVTGRGDSNSQSDKELNHASDPYVLHDVTGRVTGRVTGCDDSN